MFCGAGVGADGARQAGALVVGGVDIWEEGARSFKANFPESFMLWGVARAIHEEIVRAGN